MRKALRYATEAARLLRRHPYLVLVALAIGVVNNVDGRGVAYLIHHHTGWGRDVQAWETARTERHGEDPRLAEFQARFKRAMQRLSSWPVLVCAPLSPKTGLGGTIHLLLALSYGPGGRAPTSAPPSPAHPFLSAPVQFVLPGLIGAVTAAGYLWVLWGAVRDGRARWRVFLVPGWSVWWRLGVFAGALGIPVVGGVTLMIFGPALASMGLVMVYVGGPLSVLMALTPFIIVADRSGILRAVRISARTVIRNLPTALALTVGAQTLIWLVWESSPTIQLAQVGDWHASTRTLAGLPLDAALSGLASGIAAWYSAAMLIWYSDIAREAVVRAMPFVDADAPQHRPEPTPPPG